MNLVRLSKQIKDKIKRIGDIEEIYKLCLISTETVNAKQQYLDSKTLRLIQGRLSDRIDLMRAVLDQIAYELLKKTTYKLVTEAHNFQYIAKKKMILRNL